MAPTYYWNAPGSLYPIIEITRLLGRPQPQMYPPVALNHDTWVNRTHKHFYIYASRPHENLEIWSALGAILGLFFKKNDAKIIVLKNSS